MTQRVVIVGAGAGGDATAIGLRKRDFKGQIVLIGEETNPPYERPYLSKQFLRGEISDERVFLRPEGEYDRQDIELKLGARVVTAEVPGVLELESGESVPYDTLVLATGSTPRWPPEVPHLENTFALRSLEDGRRIREAIRNAGRILLLGAGFIGAEVAASARGMEKDVLMVEVAEVPLERALGRDMGEKYAAIHRSHGVDLRLGVGVDEWIEEDGGLVAVRLSDGSRETVDLAVIGIGVSPNLHLAEQLGLKTGPQGVEVDACLKAAPEIFAIGDIAAHYHPVFKRLVRVEHWQVGQRHGTAVAAAITGDSAPYSELPWFWSDQYDLNLQYVGNTHEFDHTVTRGDPDTNVFSIFYLRDGVIDAVLSVNDGKTGRFSRPLISNRTKVRPEVLADPHTDMRALGRTDT